MSTRAQIIVEENNDVMIYKHCDGYPEGVLPTLKELLPAFQKSRGWDPEYLTAHVCAAFMRDEFSRDFNHMSFTGHGLGSALHGDEEYVYLINTDFSVSVYVPKEGYFSAPAPTMKNLKLSRVLNLEQLKAYDPKQETHK